MKSVNRQISIVNTGRQRSARVLRAVALTKALRALGFSIKIVAKKLGTSVATARDYSSHVRYKDIGPDKAVMQAIESVVDTFVYPKS